MADKVYNVLLLGQTGVGKSTFINGCANYAVHESFESALTGDLTCLIPTKSTTTDANDELHVITFGNDENEVLVTGQSATQRCKGYVFPTSFGSIRLIDTPGVGDVRGVGQDAKNFEDLFAYLSGIEEVHRICILLESNSCRRTTVFDFCLKELFAHLSKTAKSNICFVFTKARSTDFRPGEALAMIKEVLEEVASSPPNVRIPSSKENMFCVDNGSFTYVVATKNGVKYESDAKEAYKKCWDKAVGEYSRLFEFVFSCTEPHKVVDTVSIYQARNTITRLTKPLTDVAQLIQDNINLCKHHETLINACKDDIGELKKNLYVPKLDATVDDLPHPRTICVSPKCAEVIELGSIQKYDYKQNCHERCYLRGVEAEIINNKALLHCAAMNGQTNCRICGCSYMQHMHVYYKLNVELKQVEDERQQQRIQTKSEAIAAAEGKIAQLQQKRVDLLKEEDCILKCSAKFAQFLQRNAITPFNDKFEEYIKKAIENAEMQYKKGTATKETVQNLENTLKKYAEEKKVFEKAMALRVDKEVVTPKDIEESVKELYNLKIYGNLIKQAVEKQNTARNREMSHHKEVTCKTSTKGHIFADGRLKQSRVTTPLKR